METLLFRCGCGRHGPTKWVDFNEKRRILRRESIQISKIGGVLAGLFRLKEGVPLEP
jgi:hypothetical protein